MAVTSKSHVPLVSATQFNVPGGAAIAAGSGVYGSATNAGASDWVLGSAMPKGRALLVIVNTAAIANSPTALKVALFGSATDASGTSGAEITATITEWATPAGDTAYVSAEIPLSYVSDLTKYYSLGLSVNGAGGTTTVVADAAAIVLDPVYSG
jgi:hypothetical protein